MSIVSPAAAAGGVPVSVMGMVGAAGARTLAVSSTDKGMVPSRPAMPIVGTPSMTTSEVQSFHQVFERRAHHHEAFPLGPAQERPFEGA